MSETTSTRRGDRLVGFGDESIVIFETTRHDAAKDEIKGFCPSPIFFEIVNFKCAVDRYPLFVRFCCA